MKKYLKILLWTVLALFVLVQFIRPEKNLSGDTRHDIASVYPIPPDVQGILKTSCYDCHSNTTVYPWYNAIQPIGLFLNNHVVEGKRHLNFNDFTGRKIAYQNHKLEEVVEMVEEGEMPMSSYTLIHRDAVLSAAQKEALTSWAKAIQDTIKLHYPADSLVLRRPNAPSK